MVGAGYGLGVLVTAKVDWYHFSGGILHNVSLVCGRTLPALLYSCR